MWLYYRGNTWVILTNTYSKIPPPRCSNQNTHPAFHSAPDMAFPPVPVDVIRAILEIASFSDLETTLNLTLVSASTRQWIIPLIYRTVVLPSSRSVTRFFSTITAVPIPTLKPAVPLHRRVKNLAILALGPIPPIESLISRCTSLESLACGFSFAIKSRESFHKPLTAIEKPPQQHLLGLSCRDDFPIVRICPQTTHMHIQLPSKIPASLVKIAEYLPELTHLAVSISTIAFASGSPALFRTLSAIMGTDQLKVILIQGTGPDGTVVVDEVRRWNSGVGRDLRLVAVKAPISLVKQWEESVISPADGLWCNAEREIERNRELSAGQPQY